MDHDLLASQQHLLLQHLQPAAAIPGVETPPAIDLSSKRSKDNASDRLAGASHATAAVHIPGSTTTHTKVNVAATFGQEMSPVWANFTDVLTGGSVRDEPGKTVKCCLRRGCGKECPPYTHNGAPRLLRPDICTRTAKRRRSWFLAASSTSAQAKSQRAETLVEAFILS